MADRVRLRDRYVAELIQLAKSQHPEASVEVVPVPFEDEDAHILVYVPDSTSEADMDKLGEALTERSVEILQDTGLLILVGVYEASSRRPS